MPRVAGQRVTVHFQIVQKMLQSRTRSRGESVAGIVDCKIDAGIIPAGEGKTAKTQPHLAGLCGGMQSHGLAPQRDDGIQRWPRPVEKSFSFAMRDEPGVQVARAPGIDLFENVEGRGVLVEFESEVRIDGCKEGGDGASSVLGKNQPNANCRSIRAQAARLLQPE